MAMESIDVFNGRRSIATLNEGMTLYTTGLTIRIGLH